MSEEDVKICWRAPSNIALIKYWGKKDHQLPVNASLSLTLENSTTTTTLIYRRKKARENDISVKYFFHDLQHPKFEEKVLRLLERLCSEMPFLTAYELVFRSSNNFPHSTGIASSASSMCALALCLVSMKENITGKQLTDEDFLRSVSSIARLGSGSASRSVYGGWVTWGSSPGISQSSDEYATPFLLPPESRLNQLRDSILIVSTKEKTVSSSTGHLLMNAHPYLEGRKTQANSNFNRIIDAIRTGDFHTMATIAENEALSLHALLMSSSSDGLLLHANTLHLISEIKQFRTETGLELFFTLDAGPNLHLIYPEDRRDQVLPFVQNSLLRFCEDRQWIDDKTGGGPVRL